MAESPFPFIEDDISRVLCSVGNETPEANNVRFKVTKNEERITFKDMFGGDDASTSDLVPLACLCDEILFGKNEISHDEIFVRNLVAQCKSAPGCTVSLLLGLNKLESCVRHSNSFTTGRAPLLMNMLADLTGDRGKILRCLLLPTGLNLRNLLWHGFFGSDLPVYIVRPWAALVIALIMSFEPTEHRTSNAIQNFNPLLRNSRSPSERCCQSMVELEAFGSSLQTTAHEPTGLSTAHISETLFHESFWSLWEYSLSIQVSSPTIASVIWTVLLEHALRFLWCESNKRPEDLIARNGHFYVSLDGHGQRDRHDVLLHHLRTTDQVKSELYPLLGANLMAILTDLFISGSGGPNIRAALAHGVYDEDIELELDGHQGAHHDTSALRNILLFILEQIANVRCGHPLHPNVCNYRPVFSYAATTDDCLVELLQEMDHLNNMTSTRTCAVALPAVSHASLKTRKVALWSFDCQEWSLESVYQEARINEYLGRKAATRVLLFDILEATREFVEQVSAKRSDERTTMKQLRRIDTNIHYIGVVYAFALHVAILELETDDESLTKLVIRTRAMISTVSTQILPNAERAYKAVDSYAKSKLAKKVILGLTEG